MSHSGEAPATSASVSVGQGRSGRKSPGFCARGDSAAPSGSVSPGFCSRNVPVALPGKITSESVPQACRDTDSCAKSSVSRRDMTTLIPDFGIMFWNLERNGLSLRMRIFTEQALSEYIQKHPETKTALQEWKYVVRHSEWTCFADIKKDFNSVDAVGNQRYVFNIMGNHHRIVVVIKFTIYFVYIRFIGTHTEYERMNKTIGAKNI